MKHYLYSIVALMLMMFSTSALAAPDYTFYPTPDHTITAQLILIPKEKPENPPKGERQPSMNIMAQIGEGWVLIEGVDTTEILSYDINGYDGIPVGTFNSVSEFTETLFSLEGEYELRFTTSEYVYIGYVCLP